MVLLPTEVLVQKNLFSRLKNKSQLRKQRISLFGAATRRECSYLTPVDYEVSRESRPLFFVENLPLRIKPS
jgi:hypothetical protein